MQSARNDLLCLPGRPTLEALHARVLSLEAAMKRLSDSHAMHMGNAAYSLREFTVREYHATPLATPRQYCIGRSLDTGLLQDHNSGTGDIRTPLAIAGNPIQDLQVRQKNSEDCLTRHELQMLFLHSRLDAVTPHIEAGKQESLSSESMPERAGSPLPGENTSKSKQDSEVSDKMPEKVSSPLPEQIQGFSVEGETNTECRLQNAEFQLESLTKLLQHGNLVQMQDCSRQDTEFNSQNVRLSNIEHQLKALCSILYDGAQKTRDVPADQSNTLSDEALDQLPDDAPEKAERPKSWRSSRKSFFEFEESVWDAAMFIGEPNMGFCSSCHMTLLLIINIAVQLSYTIIIAEAFADPRFTKELVRDFKRFRYQIAHDWRHLDKARHSSLTGRICSGDQAIEMATAQVDALDSINHYLPDDDTSATFGRHQGFLMCILSLIMWCSMVAVELRRLERIIYNLFRLVDTENLNTTRFRRVDQEGSIKLQLECLSYRRKVVLLGVSAMRLIIAAIVLNAGMRYLINTVDLKDLVLNALALGCVLDTDELIFSALAPNPVHLFMRSLLPIETKQSDHPFLRRVQGYGVPSGCILLSIIAIISFHVNMFLVPQLHYLEEARKALCAGEKDFVFTTSHFPPGIFWAPTASMGDNTGEKQEYAKELVKFVVHHEYPDLTKLHRLGHIYGGLFSLDSLSRWSVAESSYRANMRCQDFDSGNLFGPAQRHAYFGKLNDAMGVRIEGCKDTEIKAHCNFDTLAGELVRSVCPRTCGCHLYFSDLILTRSVSGCPASCNEWEHERLIREYNCTDVPKDILARSPWWVKFAHQVENSSVDSKWPIWLRRHTEKLKVLMLAHGCGVIENFLNGYGLDLCEETGEREFLPFHTFRLTCPLSCRCPWKGFGDRKHCPNRCFK